LTRALHDLDPGQVRAICAAYGRSEAELERAPRELAAGDPQRMREFGLADPPADSGRAARLLLYRATTSPESRREDADIHRMFGRDGQRPRLVGSGRRDR